MNISRLWAVAHISLWLVLLAVFSCISAPKIFERGPAATPARIGDESFHSTNSFLEFATGAKQASRPLIAFFDLAPPGAKILVLAREDDPLSSLLAKVSAYLAWPHPVEIVDLAPARKPRINIAALDFNSAAEVVLCRVDAPPGLAPGKRLGAGFELVFLATSKS
ncbi:MAG TPA: hypothetical protein VEI58_09500 [Chthoniobacterales bacterium]|nr:hypothetical protein [Chthoniobacterales bacterium]